MPQLTAGKGTVDTCHCYFSHTSRFARRLLHVNDIVYYKKLQKKHV
jgi:hypothetical protein